VAARHEQRHDTVPPVHTGSSLLSELLGSYSPTEDVEPTLSRLGAG